MKRMMAALAVLALGPALSSLAVIAWAQTAPACGPRPYIPAETEAWAVQDPVYPLKWHTEVQDWVKADPPICWVLARVPLTYPENYAPEGPPSQEPGPWIESLDFPKGEPCPPQAGGNCAMLPPPKVVAP